MRALALALPAVAAVALAAAACGSTTTCLIATCGGQCVDTTQDPHNCGGCATHCDACVNSHCSVVLATPSLPVEILATDGTDLFMAAPSLGFLGTGFDIFRVPVAGGSTAKLVASSTGQIEGLATDGRSVYYTFLGTPGPMAGPDEVIRVPVGGGSPTMLASSADPGMPVQAPGGIFVDGSSLYWTNGPSCAKPDCDPATTPFAVVTMPTAGGVTTTLQSLAGSQTALSSALAFDGSKLYFAANGATGGSTLEVAGADGSGKPAVVQAIGSIIDTAYSKSLDAKLTALATDGANVYWGSTGSDVWRPGAAQGPGAYPGIRYTTAEDQTSGGGPTVGTVTGIVVDATDVYWLYAPDPLQYQVWTCPKAGGTSVLIGQGFVTATGYRPTSTRLASIGSYVFWSDGAAVFRTQK